MLHVEHRGQNLAPAPQLKSARLYTASHHIQMQSMHRPVVPRLCRRRTCHGHAAAHCRANGDHHAGTLPATPAPASALSGGLLIGSGGAHGSHGRCGGGRRGWARHASLLLADGRPACSWLRCTGIPCCGGWDWLRAAAHGVLGGRSGGRTWGDGTSCRSGAAVAGLSGSSRGWQGAG